MHDLLLNTLVTKQAQFSPSVLDIVARTRSLGLHKVAAHTHNCAEYGLPEILKELGTKLAYAHLKQQKIASGLGSLRELQQDQTVKLANMFSMAGGGIRKLIPRATNAAPALRGALPSVRPGIGQLPSVPPPAVRAAAAINPKQTMRGINLQRDTMGMPSMGRLPTAG